MKVASGMSRIWPVGQDQMAAAIGSRYQSEKAAEYLPASRKSRRLRWSFGWLSSQAVLSRLKRRMSDSMAQKERRSRLRFWPKMVARLLPAHSRSGFSRLTAKDISVSTLSTPSSANMAIRLG